MVETCATSEKTCRGEAFEIHERHKGGTADPNEFPEAQGDGRLFLHGDRCGFVPGGSAPFFGVEAYHATERNEVCH